MNVFNANEYYKYILPGVNDANTDDKGGYILKIDNTDGIVKRRTEAYYYCL
jgi:hypothetical protein